ncbi:MAG: nitroreductase family protein [Firmicutes bacterium]|nr:nitroreductase family protein [Bacillota bacterium]
METEVFRLDHLLIDSEKCRRDGICARDCPMGIIRFNGPDALPSAVHGAAEVCINCGHCVAVCPHGALSLRGMKAEECSPLRKELLPTPEQAAHFLTSRRSIRQYKARPVTREILSRLIEVAGYAPSGHNIRPVNWLVIEDGAEVKRLAGLVIDWMRLMIKEKPELAGPLHMDKVVSFWEKGVDRICRGAPHVILAHAPASLRVAQPSCTIALTYLELAAYSMGLGACWAGFFAAAAAAYPPLTRELGLPEGHQCFGAMMVGYPAVQYHRIPLRKKPAITWR